MENFLVKIYSFDSIHFARINFPGKYNKNTRIFLWWKQFKNISALYFGLLLHPVL